MIVTVVAFALAGETTTLAQSGYGQPYNYDPSYGQQPGYGQPGYNQPYGQPGYNQPYTNDPYGQANGLAPDFYNNLAPYGQWVQTPEYGTVWIPNVEPGFQPYATNGHWIVTEYGNTWVSDYAWGWAPFHYGRWFVDRYNRWGWVPGYDWGPAWVSWRSGGGYYGWAPLGPGLNINLNVNIPPSWWVFVPQVYITSPRLYSYCVPRPRAYGIYQNTIIINNVYRVNNRAYAFGPRREEIEYVTRQRVPVYRIDNAGAPGRTVFRDNSAGFYRPDLGRGGDGGRYAGQQRTYSRGDGRPDAGAYNGGFRNSPSDNYPRYGQQPSSSPWGSSGRGSRFDQEAVSQPQSQVGQSFPQSRPEPRFPRQWDGGQGQEPNIQRGNAPRGDAPRGDVQPQGGFGQRNNGSFGDAPRGNSQPQGDFGQRGDVRRGDAPREQGQHLPPQGGFGERNGGSRGPR